MKEQFTRLLEKEEKKLYKQNPVERVFILSLFYQNYTLALIIVLAVLSFHYVNFCCSNRWDKMNRYFYILALHITVLTSTQDNMVWNLTKPKWFDLSSLLHKTSNGSATKVN